MKIEFRNLDSLDKLNVVTWISSDLLMNSLMVKLEW